MSVSYDPSLSTDKDWVRLLISDRDTSLKADDITPKAVLDDNEILALLVEEPNKYLAAARAADLVLSRTRGMVSKQVDDLRITYGDSPESSYRKHIEKLTIRGNELLRDNSRFFRAL